MIISHPTCSVKKNQHVQIPLPKQNLYYPLLLIQPFLTGKSSSQPQKKYCMHTNTHFGWKFTGQLWDTPSPNCTLTFHSLYMYTYALECRMTKSLSMITSAPTFVVVTASQHHQPGGSWMSFFLCSPLAIWMHIFFTWLCMPTSSKESYRKQWALYTHSYKLITLCSLEWWAQTITSQRKVLTGWPNKWWTHKMRSYNYSVTWLSVSSESCGPWECTCSSALHSPVMLS